MKVKKLIAELEMFDKNLEVLIDGEWINRLDVVDTKETKYDVPYINIYPEEEIDKIEIEKKCRERCKP